MDRLTEIRQRTEAGGLIRRIDMKWMLSEVDRLNALHKREIIITGEYAQRVIDLTARAEAAEAARDAAVEDLKIFSACCQCNANIDGSCCDMFDGTAENKYFCSNWQWRGPQAGKGETNGNNAR